MVISSLFTQLTFAKSAGTITFSMGFATITHADKSINPAVKNADIHSGDIIEARDGRVQLALIDGAKCRCNRILFTKSTSMSFLEVKTEVNTDLQS